MLSSMSVLILIISSLYFMLPAYLANMSAEVFSRIISPKIKFLARPIDNNKKWHGKPIFGSHKTWGGLIYASLAGIIVFFIQRELFVYSSIKQISLIDYSSTSLLLGFLLGFGAITGDLIKSFFKRRTNIPPGKPWIPFDQLDFLAGAVIFSLPMIILNWQNYLVIFLVTPLLHILINRIGYYINIRKDKI